MNVQTPRFSDRFNHLPRPLRRIRNVPMSHWLGANQSSMQNSEDSMDGYDSAYASTTPPVGNPFPSVRLGNLIGDVSRAGTPSAIATPMPEPQDWTQRDVITASSETVNMQFTTPEIQSSMMELTRIVAHPSEQWNLAPLASRAQLWIDQSNDPIARGEARLLLERIESFEQLRRRSASLSTSAAYLSPLAPTVAGDRGLSPAWNSPAPMNPSSMNTSSGFHLAGFEKPLSNPTPTSPGLSSNWSSPSASPLSNSGSGSPTDRTSDGAAASDASGWLVQVYSGVPGQPEFALTDDNGAVITYVQPTPGMNLRRYLRQPVGIYGVKGYLPNLNAKQIIAERIVRIR